MTTDNDEAAKGPLLRLKPWQRVVGIVVSVAFAVAHVVRPDWAIDAVFLGLLAFAVYVAFFDVESFELLGMRAQRRRIARAQEELDKAPPSTKAVIPPPAPATKVTEALDALTEKGLIEKKGRYYSLWADNAWVKFQNPDPWHFYYGRRSAVTPQVRQAALFLLALEDIRVELVILAGNSGLLQRVADWESYQTEELIEYLQPTKVLSAELVRAVRTVTSARNDAVHSSIAEAAYQLAMDVVQKLRDIPRPYFRVREPNVEVFKDPALQVPHENSAVMLAQINQDGTTQPPNVYPRKLDYTKGRFVSWQWDLSSEAGQAWYRNPSSSQPELAWGAASLFAGREYPEQWHLELRLPTPDYGL